MDAFELLKKDHQKVADLFSRTESAAGREKLRVFAQLKAELDLHAHIEETVLYPALENTKEAHEITLEAYEEHNVVKDLLAQLSSGATPEDEWDAKLKVLKENVEHHVEEEEGEMFGKARRALDQPRIEELGAELEAEKNRALVNEQKSATTGRRAEAKAPNSESPGVLQRLANLVGLGGEPAADSSRSVKKRASQKRTRTGTTSKAPKKTAAKKSAPKGTTAKKAAGKKATASNKSGKAASRTATRKATARSAKTATKASRAGASKRSSASRSAATKSAPRAASNKRVNTNKSKQAGKFTKSKSRSR